MKLKPIRGIYRCSVLSAATAVALTGCSGPQSTPSPASVSQRAAPQSTSAQASANPSVTLLCGGILSAIADGGKTVKEEALTNLPYVLDFQAKTIRAKGAEPMDATITPDEISHKSDATARLYLELRIDRRTGDYMSLFRMTEDNYQRGKSFTVVTKGACSLNGSRSF